LANNDLPAWADIKKLVTLLGATGMFLATHAHADTTAIPATAGATAARAYLPDVARLEAVSYRLSRESSDLCERPQMLSGLLLHDLGGFSAQTRPAAIRTYGLGYGFGVTHVLADSPAGRAGMEEGDEIVSVNGANVTTFARNAIGRRASYARTEAFTGYLDAALRMGPATLALRRGQTIVNVTLDQESGCGGKAVVQRQKTLNAFSDGRYVAVTTTMMRFLDSDSELAFVVAHEMAHNILHHASKRNRKATVRAMLPNSHTGTKSAEIEADELAVQLMARAGYDLNAPEGFFGRATKVRRAGLSLTHPSNARRLRTVSAVIARIEGDKSEKRPNVYLASLTPPPVLNAELASKRYDAPAARSTAFAIWQLPSPRMSAFASGGCAPANLTSKAGYQSPLGAFRLSNWDVFSLSQVFSRHAYEFSPSVLTFGIRNEYMGCRTDLQSLVSPGRRLSALFALGGIARS